MKTYSTETSLAFGNGRLVAASEVDVVERLVDHAYTTGVGIWMFHEDGYTVTLHDPDEISSFCNYLECSLLLETEKAPYEMSRALATLLFPGHSVLMAPKELELLRSDARAMKQFTPPDDISPRFADGRLEFWVQHYFVNPTHETFLWSVTCDIGADNSLDIEKPCAARWKQYRA